MSEITTNNKRIIKNSTFLYLRMLLSIAVSLYTSRVVLNTLGETDYGVYSLVGTIVMLFAFLNTCMSSATSRFLTYELSRGDDNILKKTFSTAMSIHISIAIIIFIVAEIAGLWFVPELDIPDNRRFAAQIVYQLSILSMMITVTQVPYNATIIAHEKMDIYAYVELLHVVLKLLIVYILMIGNFDKLILYAILILVVNIIVAFTYRIYCIKHYKESHFKLTYDKSITKQMLSFSLWDLYGNMSVSVRQQGTNILINKFFGTALNAASGIATTVQGIISGFSSNILQAFRPQIIKNYSIGEYKRMEELMRNAITFALLMLFIISMPLIIEIEYVMHLWLGEVPDYATTFCRILLLMNFIGAINVVLTTAIHASGKVKLLSFSAGTIALLCVPTIFLLFRFCKCTPEAAYYVLITAAILMIVIDLSIIKNKIPNLCIIKIISTILKTTVVGILSLIPILIVQKIDLDFIRLVLTTIIYFATITSASYFCLLDSNTRNNIRLFIKKQITKLKK